MVEGGLDPHMIKIWKKDFKLMHFIFVYVNLVWYTLILASK
jgi:hypothetical protein